MPRERRRRLRTASAVALVVALTAALRLPLLDLPFERDEGGYAYIAWRLDFGELPYRDWFDQKAPGIFWVYRLALEVPVDPRVAIRLVAGIFSAATAVALLLVARRLLEGPWPLCAAVLFAFLSADPRMQGPIANTERFMLLPLVLAHLLFLRSIQTDRGGRRALVGVGALVGLATAFKQVAAVELAFFAVAFPLLVPAERRVARPATVLLLLAGGVALVWVAIALPFAAWGALPDLLDAVLLHNLRYAQAISLGERAALLGGTLSSLAYSQVTIWLAAAAGAASLASAPRRWIALYPLGWIAASAVGVSASGYYFPHYFQQAAAPVALLATAGAAFLVRADPRAAGPWQALPPFARAGAVLAALLAAPMATVAPYLAVYAPEQAIRRMYPGNPFEVMPAVARRIAEITRPDETVFVFGAEPEIFFDARRRSASRYIYLFPLYGPYPGVRARQEAAMGEIIASRPASAVFLPNALFFRNATEQHLTERVREYLEDEFEPDSLLVSDASGHVSLVRSDGGTPPAPPPGGRILGGIFRRAR